MCGGNVQGDIGTWQLQQLRNWLILACRGCYGRRDLFDVSIWLICTCRKLIIGCLHLPSRILQIFECMRAMPCRKVQVDGGQWGVQ